MPTRAAGEGGEALTDLVGQLDEETLRDLVRCAAERHEDVASSVRLASASPADRVLVLRAEVDRGLRTRRYLDYWQSSTWAHDAAPIVDALAEAVAAGPTKELVVLLERSAGHVVKVILRADDSNGMIGDLAHQLLELHAVACDSGVADPVKLARWMTRFSFDDQDFFFVDPVRYGRALGEKGLAAYRHEVTKRWEAGADGFAVTHARERLAVLDRDLALIVELIGGDLATPHRFIGVAEAMVELDLADEALEWARRGIEETTGWQVAKLYDIAARVLADRGEHTEVFELRQDQHERMSSASTYASLRAAAEMVGSWGTWRDDARKLLLARDRGGLVDALLADGDADAAWATATEDADWDPGDQRWQRLAEAREGADPGAAMTVFLLLADRALREANRGAYQLAIRRLKAARRTAAAAGMDEHFRDHLNTLRETHRRRPTLIAMLDKSAL